MFRITKIHHEGDLYSTWLKLQDWFYRVRDVDVVGVMAAYSARGAHVCTTGRILAKYFTSLPDYGSL